MLTALGVHTSLLLATILIMDQAGSTLRSFKRSYCYIRLRLHLLLTTTGRQTGSAHYNGGFISLFHVFGSHSFPLSRKMLSSRFVFLYSISIFSASSSPTTTHVLRRTVLAYVRVIANEKAGAGAQPYSLSLLAKSPFLFFPARPVPSLPICSPFVVLLRTYYTLLVLCIQGEKNQFKC